MTSDLPNDSDGDALRRLVATGSDLTKEMEIDFAVDVPDRETGLEFAAAAGRIGFRTELDRDDDSGEWTCYCSRTMIPTYEAIIGAERILRQLGSRYNAKPDGWGTFGNASQAG
jgi:hypothetical protein